MQNVLRVGVLCLALVACLGVAQTTWAGDLSVPVTVTNSRAKPVPVTGTVGVTGPVGVTGTVNVGNTVPVKVDTSTERLRVQDGPAMSYSAHWAEVSISDTVKCSPIPSGAVPAGMNVVIENLSFHGELPTGQQLLFLFLQAAASGLETYVPVSFQATDTINNVDHYTANVMIRRVFTPADRDANGDLFGVCVSRNNNSSTWSYNISLTGYLTECAGTLCTK